MDAAVKADLRETLARLIHKRTCQCATVFHDATHNLPGECIGWSHADMAIADDLVTAGWRPTTSATSYEERLPSIIMDGMRTTPAGLTNLQYAEHLAAAVRRDAQPWDLEYPHTTPGGFCACAACVRARAMFVVGHAPEPS